jgi:Copper amine oxidase N-terminal domain
MLKRFALCAALLVATATKSFADTATPMATTSPAPSITIAPTAAPSAMLPVTPPMDFGSPPPGEVPILFNDHHVYANPDALRQGRVLSALVKDNTILVPLRSMFEQMGATVSYDPATKSATASKPGSEIQVTLGKNEVLINGESRPLDVAPVMYQGVLLVPVRVISESLGAYVQWVPEQHLTVVRYIAPTPVPTPPLTPAPKPVPSPTPPPIPSDFDPCGGPLELFNKLGNGTACVFVRGEAAITAGYGSANIPVNSQINFDTPLGSRTLFGLGNAAHAFGYPASIVYIGVAPRAQIAITPPSFVQINGGGLEPQTGTNVLAAGASDMKFEYKQLVYVNLPKFTMLAIDLAYKAPTGSPRLSGAGPSYTIDPILTQPLPHGFGVTLAFPVNNFTILNRPICGMHPTGGTFCMPGGTQRGWSWTPQLYPYWESPGGTLVALTIQHDFSPSVTPVIFTVGQQFGRHFGVIVSEGGFNYSASATGPFQGLVNASATAYPSLFTASVNYLFGRSDLPAALQ